jgi:predicted GIY-YIG superfamily endonuclease
MTTPPLHAAARTPRKPRKCGYDAPYSIYIVRCIDTDNFYVGRSQDPNTRLKGLRSNPPKGLAADVKQYKPFDTHFTFQILQSDINNISCAIAAETSWIDRLGATTNGANKLDTESVRDPKFWAMQHGLRPRK